MKHYRVTTLGCKVNQCESAALGNLLETEGYAAARDVKGADLVVVNTCTVTRKAAMQSRQAIRQAVRNNPGAKIVVTGCYAQTTPQEIRDIEGVDLIVGHSDKLRICEFLKQSGCMGGSTMPGHNPNIDPKFSPLPSAANKTRTRAFLKVQDGCNARCTYCIVPHARGSSRSMPPADVHSHLAKLAAAGLREVVLTGIHLGAYGLDLDPPTSLSELVIGLLRSPKMDRIRLSSIEPTEVDPTIVRHMAACQGTLCRHFHIPLQSGADPILKRMGRPYTRDQYAQLILDIHGQLPQAAIGADVLVGFPGEDQTDFAQTYALIEELPLTYLHVFPFSARPGTPAATYRHKVPDAIIKMRCRELRKLGEVKKRAFYRAMIGQTLKVLIETTCNPQTGHAGGLSDNYLSVVLPRARVNDNDMVSARIVGIGPRHTAMGEIIGQGN